MAEFVQSLEGLNTAGAIVLAALVLAGAWLLGRMLP
jgi:hypothetical protein